MSGRSLPGGEAPDGDGRRGDAATARSRPPQPRAWAPAPPVGGDAGSLVGDLRVLLALARGARGGGDHGERLERFYASQAADYDRFRERLLHGRGELLSVLPLPEGGVLVELGAGTGRNLDFLGARVAGLRAIHLVDLCPSLLARAEERCAARGWERVRCHQADVTAWTPPAPVDAVVLSYALTMIPDWAAAVRNAVAMLRPGGHLAVVDFFVSHRDPHPGRARHGALARWFWPRWFGHDGVRPDPLHLDLLQALTVRVRLDEGAGRVPWLPGLRAPYYRYLGRRPE